MTYLVFCTFDLKNASSQDYQYAYSDLAALGLSKVHVGDNGVTAVVPTTSAMGWFSGVTSQGVSDHVCLQVQAAFRARRFTSEIFLTVGQSAVWAARTT